LKKVLQLLHSRLDNCSNLGGGSVVGGKKRNECKKRERENQIAPLVWLHETILELQKNWRPLVAVCC
jgi:hypothetical protein